MRALSLQRADQGIREVCGVALFPDRREQINIDSLVNSLRAPGDPLSQHRGEAETVVLIRDRADLNGSVFISDDAGALRLAEHELHGSRCYTTVDILVRAEVAGRITNDEAHDDLRRLRQEERYVRPADAAGYDIKVARLRDVLLRSRGVQRGA